MAIRIREGRDEDSAQVIALIERCYAEYPGCVLDVENEAPELKAVASSHLAQDGRFWVAESEGRIVGCIGIVPGKGERTGELKKLYVDQEWRRQGLAARLCDLVEAHARAKGAVAIELWSDTRFAEAHRLYGQRGYARGKMTRELHDRSQSVEYFFNKQLH